MQSLQAAAGQLLTPSADPVSSLIDTVSRECPDLFKRPVLIYKSRSVQYASAEFPRVLIFGPQAVAAFSGKPGEFGYDKLEVISYSRDNHEFQFAEFSAAGGRITANLAPKSCSFCHHSPGRPVWDQYPVWPGVFGSDADNLRENSRETVLYRSFLQGNAKRGRYAHLQLTEPGPLPWALPHEPNDALSMYLASNNYDRIRYLIQENPDFRGILPVMGAAFSGCPPESFLPANIAERVNADVEAQEELVEERLDKLRSDLMTEMAHKPIKGTFGARQPLMVAAAVLRNLGVSPRSLTMQFDVEVDFFNEPYNDAFLEFMRSMALPSIRYRHEEEDCAAVVTGSAPPGAWVVPKQWARRRNRLDDEAPILRCAYCHSYPYSKAHVSAKWLDPRVASGPEIPFLDAIRLREMMRGDRAFSDKMRAIASGTASAPMPPQPFESLTQAERESLAELLESLR